MNEWMGCLVTLLPGGMRRGIEAFAQDLRGHVVRLWEDNQAVVHIIRNKTSRSPLLADVTVASLYLQVQRASRQSQVWFVERQR